MQVKSKYTYNRSRKSKRKYITNTDKAMAKLVYGIYMAKKAMAALAESCRQSSIHMRLFNEKLLGSVETKN